MLELERTGAVSLPTPRDATRRTTHRGIPEPGSVCGAHAPHTSHALHTSHTARRPHPRVQSVRERGRETSRRARVLKVARGREHRDHASYSHTPCTPANCTHASCARSDPRCEERAAGQDARALLPRFRLRRTHVGRTHGSSIPFRASCTLAHMTGRGGRRVVLCRRLMPCLLHQTTQTRPRTAHPRPKLRNTQTLLADNRT